MDVEFLKICSKDGSESRIMLSLSRIVESAESEQLDNEYMLQSGVRVVTDYGATYFLLIKFDEFKELYELMMNKKIVFAR